MILSVVSTNMAAIKGSGPQVIDISKLNLEQLTTLKNQLDQVSMEAVPYMWGRWGGWKGFNKGVIKVLVMAACMTG